MAAPSPSTPSTPTSTYQAFFKACERGEMEKIRNLVPSVPDIDHQDTVLDDKYGALHYACLYGQREVVDYLLDAGASVDLPTSSGRSPLNIAIKHGHSEIVALLLMRGANLFFPSPDGRTPLEFAANEEIKAMIRERQRALAPLYAEQLGVAATDLLTVRQSGSSVQSSMIRFTFRRPMIATSAPPMTRDEYKAVDMAYLATDGAVDGGVPISEFPTLVESLGYANVDGATAARLAEATGMNGPLMSRHNFVDMILRLRQEQAKNEVAFEDYDFEFDEADLADNRIEGALERLGLGNEMEVLKSALVAYRDNVGMSAASEAAAASTPRAKIAQKSPYRVDLEAGQKVLWCSCGHSKRQPYCDFSHMAVNKEQGTSFEPVRFEAPETKTYSLCGCKQSADPVVCDGSHRELRPTIAQKAPYAVELDAGETVFYCTCGRSSKQPACDGTHARVNAELGTEFKPTAFEADEAKTYYFCGCRRSSDVPLCDGSHKVLLPNVAQAEPFEVAMEEGEELWWCACGFSGNQPVCDGTHARINKARGTSFAPIPFTAAEKKTYWLCGCRRTKHAPACDGSHNALSDALGGVGGSGTASGSGAGGAGSGDGSGAGGGLAFVLSSVLCFGIMVAANTKA